MRIIHEFNHRTLKATLFFHHEKYTLKLEDEFGSIQYKLGKLEKVVLKEIESTLQQV